ncbi:MAG: hypothetical protein IT182_00020 [Acidobacteria bacterium]|nr:hypothetical protein [Acidobacteriota bacterium]
MTPCSRYLDEDEVLRYVAGDMDDGELSVFEDHLFACDACLARVERYQAAQQVLARRAPLEGPVIVAASNEVAVPVPSRGLPWWALGAVAAGLVVTAIGVATWNRPPASLVVSVERVAERSPAPEPAEPTSPAHASSSHALQVAVLAMVMPPPYLTLTTRGASDEAARFAQGMEAYTKADWTTAARLLGEVATAEARFYEGIADLMRGEAATAAATLERARASGVQPYARESVFYIGKAALQQGDIPHARQAFATARDTGATTARDATRLIAALDELSAAH